MATAICNRLNGLAAISLSAVLSVSPAFGDTAEQFFAGNTVRIVVGAGGGGGYDLYGRVLGRYLGEHIPGKPTVIVENMPGGGGNVAANYVYNVAPKTGLVLNMPFMDLPLRQLTRPQGIRYDMQRVHWLGNMAELTTVLAVHKDAPAQSLEEAKMVEVIMGNSGIGDETYVMPSIANTLLGTKFRFVSGYPGTAAITAAMDKGEVHGRGGSWISWKVLNPHFIKEKKIKLLAQGGLRKDPDLPDVPLISGFARNDDDRAIVRLVVALPIGISRAIMAPPGVPKDRVQALRRAFDATMADPDLLADANKRSVAISPSTGEVVESRVAEIISATPEMIERAKVILGYTKAK
ncbi:MAG: hypothetical protein GEU92_12480 [Alphaproteobacteria bacterium]|nr:hypothetical protein [Alphaproteobacteria bacterium]